MRPVLPGLLLLAAVGASGVAAVVNPPPPAAKPNLVYILADDLGYGDVACQNPKSKIPTPQLDRLATQGIRFVDAHSPSAVCTPTRYGILTGRYAWRSRLKRSVLGGFSPPLIEPGRWTVASFLRPHGYATACIGKWHLGMTWPRKGGGVAGSADSGEEVDFSQPIRDGPCERGGFDYFYGFSASLDMPPYVFIENNRTVALPTVRQEKWGFVRAGPKAPDFKFDEVLPQLTRQAVQFIARQAGTRARQPFFLLLSLNAPHTPVVPAAFVKGRSQAGEYGDFVAEVDWAVGEVLQALEAQGVATNTLVIVTSDNGPERTAYERAREYRHFSMGDWRGLKRDTWEGGHRVPFLARWPGHIRPGSVSDEVICLTDLLATVAAMVGAELPADAGEDSCNILPALLGQPRDRPLREWTVHHSDRGRFALRRGPWVLIDAPSGDDNQEPEWFQQERGYRPHSFPGELYDLTRDPGQRNNLWGDQPEVVRQLKACLEQTKAAGRSLPIRPAAGADGNAVKP